MRLYGFWRSTATWRVRIALAHKQLPYTLQPIDLITDGGGQQRRDHHLRNPMEQVPVLELEPAETGGEVAHLAQSVAILEYLEECHPEPPLLPRDPLARARVRQLTEVVNAGIQPLQNHGVQLQLESLGVDSPTWVRHFVARGLRALEEHAKPLAGRYLVGDALSFADILMVPELAFARRYEVDLSGLDTLLRVEATCLALPCFIDADPYRQPDAPPR